MDSVSRRPRRRSVDSASCSSSKQRVISDPWQEQDRQSSFTRDFYSACYSNDANTAALIRSNSGDDIHYLEQQLGALSMKEARWKLRLEHLTPSQWGNVMEACGISVQRDASVADKVVQVIEWRSRRGDFEKHDDDEEEDVQDVDEVPQLCDDVEGVSEACLEWGFLKSDLQVECLLRGISYEGHDSKAQLISKLMEHKQSNSLNSFEFLAKQSQ